MSLRTLRPLRLREKSCEMREMEGEVGVTDPVWEAAGPKIKGNSFIIYQLPAAITRHDRALKTGRLWWKWDEMFVASSVPRLTRHISAEPGHPRTTRGPGERSEANDWQMSDGVCVLGSLKPSSDENLKSMGCISEGSVWSAPLWRQHSVRLIDSLSLNV